MSHTICYLFSCTLVLTTITGTDWDAISFKSGIGFQCIKRGPYPGACKGWNKLKFNGELTCWSLTCAFERNPGLYIADYTGAMDDGTICGHNKVCKAGECVPQNLSDTAFSIEHHIEFECVSPVVEQTFG